MTRGTVALASLLAVGTLIGAADAPKKTPITLKQFQEEYELIGVLGVPLGRTVTIDATALESREKCCRYFLRITAIDDRPLKEPIVAEPPHIDWGYEPLDARPGETLRLRVYEDGGFLGTPEAAEKERPPRKDDEPAPAMRAYQFGFYTNLNLVRVLKHDKSNRPPQPDRSKADGPEF